MNILRVIPSMNPALGGPCQGIRNSIPELSQLGVNNEVVCFDDPASNFLEKDTFKIHALGKSKGPWAYNPNLKEWLSSNLGRFDIVIIHGLWLYHGYATMEMISKHRKTHGTVQPKVYVMPHGMLDPWFQRDSGRKLKAIRNWAYWKIIENKVVNYSDGLLFTSEEEMKLAREPFRPYHPKRELNVGYGIMAPPPYTKEMSDRFREVLPSLNGDPYILFLSRINVKKGIDLLITGYMELKKQGFKLPKLVIAGPGSDTSYGKNLIDLASSDTDIIFPGMLSGLEKWGAFYECEAFILPSHQENFGISVVESLACEKPVLISNQVNIWNEIKNGGGGFVSIDNLEGVKELLVSWISLTAEEKQTMSKKASEVYLNNYAISEAARTLKEHLE